MLSEVNTKSLYIFRSEILETKQVSQDKSIALVYWPEKKEFSTHVIYDNKQDNLISGNYFDTLTSAYKDFKKRR